MAEIAVSELAHHEAVIERGLNTFVDVGNALLAIRNERLYRADHDTFEDYCRERWGFSDRRASQFIEAASVVPKILETGLPAPTVESQARELARVPEPERAEVWRETVERTGGKPTAAAIRDTYKPPPSDAEMLAGTEWGGPTALPIDQDRAEETVAALDEQIAQGDTPNEDDLLAAIERRQPGARAAVDRTRIRARWSRAIAGAADIPLQDQESVNAVLSDTELNVAINTINDAQRWLAGVRTGRRGLRIIGGKSQ